MNRPTCRTCRTCQHWHPADPKFSHDQPLDALAEGQCRAHPPTAHLVPIRTLSGEQLTVQGLFPLAMSTTFCGEHSDHAATPWTKDNGFSRAPSLEEARKFTPKIVTTEEYAAKRNMLNSGSIEETPDWNPDRDR